MPVSRDAGSALERRFVRALREAAALSPQACILAAVSGGPDSTALLLLLAQAASVLGFELQAAYFDHGIRSLAEREAERRHVRRLAAAAAVPLGEGSADVPARARDEHRSLEEQARLDRYRFLAAAAAACGAGAVATGHTLNDNVETILLHVLRGAGLAGLLGMQPQRQWPFGSGPLLLRPLLTFSRAETEAYCGIRDIEPFRDSENEAPRTRNRLRHQLLPLLRELNPAADAAIMRLSSAAAADQRLIDELAAAALGTAFWEAERGAIGRERVLALHTSVRHELWFRLFAALLGDRQGLNARHIAALDALVARSEAAALDLPRGICAWTDGNHLYFGRQPTVASPLPERELSLPGAIRAGPWLIETSLLSADEPQQPPARWSAYFDFDRLALPLRIRSRRPGDRLQPLGMQGTKKLQDLLTDARVPRGERDGVPLIVAGEQILWVAGYRRSRLALPGPQTRVLLSVSLSPSANGSDASANEPLGC